MKPGPPKLLEEIADSSLVVFLLEANVHFFFFFLNKSNSNLNIWDEFQLKKNYLKISKPPRR